MDPKIYKAYFINTLVTLRGYIHVTVSLKWFTLILWHLDAVVKVFIDVIKENLEN